MSRSDSPASNLPAVHRLLAHPELADLPRDLLVSTVRAVLAETRADVLLGTAPPDADALVALIRRRFEETDQPDIRPVINATGVVVHTNLGRSPLAAAAVEALTAAAGYGSVEMDLVTGARGERLRDVRARLTALTGAEDAIVVNNNAAAVLLAVTALARGREVVASRGEAVEIGGSFRIPEVVASGGATLVEVGCTNRTRLADHEAALGPHTAGILKVHPSNFRIEGFVSSPDRRALVELADRHGLFVVEDLGAGCLTPGLGEPLVRDVVRAGVHVVCFSGDKLLGGPQAGIIVGRKAWVQRLRRHPMYRALRVDKLILAALDATLRLHASGRAAEIPTVDMLTRPPEESRRRARALAERLQGRHPATKVVRTSGRTGGGARPEVPLRSWAVALWGLDVTRLAARLREGDPPVIGRIRRDRLLLDPLTVLEGQEDALVSAVLAAIAEVLEEEGP